ncbi:hypothetical protein [Luteimonas terrae]|uniref:Gas vesicle protein n=1 Tax=Luteimonas terrae TaxID=1530191 RepID=A0ABU1XXA4_9GAMM|nr:hypothetical protein [Luteimonas terrae]MDR7192716.1 gas vesicle protein [Luteimonas terrae]
MDWTEVETPHGPNEIAVIPIRYDGLDAESHQIDLAALGESLQGMSKVLGVVGHFVVTGKYAKQVQALDVRVVALEEPKANCFRIDAALQFVQQQGMLQGSIGAVIGVIVTWLVARNSNKSTEMKMLKDSLDRAIHEMAQGNQATIQALTQTLERVAEGTRPALRRAVTPVGGTCTSMTIGGVAKIDIPTAEAIRSDTPDEVDDARPYIVRITELDLESSSAKLRLGDGDDDARVAAQIIDPAFAVPGNLYMQAFTTQAPLRVTAKATLRDGAITRLYVSDARSP